MVHVMDPDIYPLDVVSATEAKSMTFAELSQSLLSFHESACKLRREMPAFTLLKWDGVIRILEQKVSPVLEWTPYPKPPPSKPEVPTGRNSRAKKKRRVLLEAYDNDLVAFREAKEEWEKGRIPQAECIRLNRETDILRQIASNRRKEMNAFKEGGGFPQAKLLRWELLPHGNWPRDVASAGLILQALPDKKPCLDRLVYARELNPTNVYRGIGDFQRYCAFEYANTPRVLLESPDDGNAAYILKRNWKSLSCLTKFQLNRLHTNDIVRVIHRPDSNWRLGIRRALFS
jgi:hypothetical protein